MNFKGLGEKVEENPMQKEVSVDQEQVGVISGIFAEEEQGNECEGMADERWLQEMGLVVQMMIVNERCGKAQ